MAKKRDWGTPDGHMDGRAATFTADNGDGYLISVTLQANVDGVLICSGANIQYKDKSSAPSIPINSRFYQLLGFGEILNEVRGYYIEFANIEDKVFWEIDLENQLKDWTALGPQGFPDEKYAAVAYMYMKFVREGLENPITALAEFMDCTKNTASSRVMEARARGLLSKPKVGTYGGKLTSKYEQIVKKPTAKGEKSNAKKGK